MLRFIPSLVLVLGLLALTPAAWAQSAEGSRSSLAGISFTDPPIQLPVTESFEDAMLNVAADLQRRCRTIEAYGWRLRQAEQKRVNDIFDATALQLGANKFKLVPRTPRSASPEVTVFTADKSEQSLLFLWSAGELGLVLLICDTETAAPGAVPMTVEKPQPAIKKPTPAKPAPQDDDLPPVVPETEKPKGNTEKPTKPKEAAKTATKKDDKPAKAKDDVKAKPAKPDAKKAEPAKSDGKKTDAKKPAPAKTEAKKPVTKKPEVKKPEAKKVEPAKPAAKKTPEPVDTAVPKDIAPEVREMLESLPDISAPTPAPQPEATLPLPQEPETPDMAPITPSEAARHNSLMPAPITTAPGVLLSPDVVPPDSKAPAPKAPVPLPVIEPPVLEPAPKADILPAVPAVEPTPAPPVSLPEAPSEMPMPPAPAQ